MIFQSVVRHIARPAGLSVSNVLLYGTAGLAYGDLRANSFGAERVHVGLGWVAGIGAEVGFTPHWSAKAEWLYLDLSNKHVFVTGANNGCPRTFSAWAPTTTSRAKSLHIDRLSL